MKVETVEQYLARGGEIRVCAKPKKIPMALQYSKGMTAWSISASIAHRGGKMTTLARGTGGRRASYGM